MSDHASGNSLSDDLLRGGDAIAEFIYGDKSKRRKVYHKQNSLPLFRIGCELCARKTTLLKWIADQEGRAA